jgi:hypothetical protein
LPVRGSQAPERRGAMNVPTDEDKQFIRENAKIECPPEEVAKYLRIFEKYPGIYEEFLYSDIPKTLNKGK